MSNGVQTGKSSPKGQPPVPIARTAHVVHHLEEKIVALPGMLLLYICTFRLTCNLKDIRDHCGLPTEYFFQNWSWGFKRLKRRYPRNLSQRSLRIPSRSQPWQRLRSTYEKTFPLLFPLKYSAINGKLWKGRLVFRELEYRIEEIHVIKTNSTDNQPNMMEKILKKFNDKVRFSRLKVIIFQH